MDLGLRSKVYIVTGASRGLGFASAHVLVADGANVVLSARDEASAAAAAGRLAQHAPELMAGAASWVTADNADPATPGRLVDAARERFGRLDGALISVGGPPAGTVMGTPDEAWRSAFETVFLGAVRLARTIAAELCSPGAAPHSAVGSPGPLAPGNLAPGRPGGGPGNAGDGAEHGSTAAEAGGGSDMGGGSDSGSGGEAGGGSAAAEAVGGSDAVGRSDADRSDADRSDADGRSADGRSANGRSDAVGRSDTDGRSDADGRSADRSSDADGRSDADSRSAEGRSADGRSDADGRGGSIVFVLSSSVRAPIAQLAISNGLRPGLAGVVKTLADELGPAGIRVNGLLPARIATGRVRELDALAGDPGEIRARLSRQIPLRRYGEPEEFARVAAFLLSPAASYLTGAMIPVDGGAIRSI
jgi:NAD(P)-dependent dehydrogenase (short-subunit alcohol dehydrogenase family)